MKKMNYKRVFSLIILVFAVLLLCPSQSRAEEVIVRIEGPANTLFAETVNAPSTCNVAPTATTTPVIVSSTIGVKAICVLQTLQEQNRLTYQTTQWSFGFSLDRVNDISNTPDWSQTWIIYKNNVSAAVGIGDLDLALGDELLLTYGAWPMVPMALTVSSSSLRVGSTTTLSAAAYDESGSLAPWTGQTTFYLSGATTSSPNGTIEWAPETSASVSVWAEAAGKTRSKKNAITVLLAPIPAPSASPLPPEIISNADIAAAENKILSYIASQQDQSGKIFDSGVSDWTAMSFGANGQYASDIKNNGSSLLDYLLAFQLTTSTDINACAGYARHALGLLSAGIDAVSATTTALIAKMTGPDCYANNRYGPDTGINDDVFALMALLAAGKSSSEQIIVDMVSSTQQNQQINGSFTYGFGDAADLTGAAMAALKYAEQKGINIPSDIFNNAKQYLRSTQLSDGGWGYAPNASDVLTTAWVMMGINALGETQSQWATSTGKTPWQPLVSQLLPAGYYTSSYSPVDWFATKHAVPALLGKSWPIVLSPRTATAPSAQNQGGSYNPPNVGVSASSPIAPIVAPTTTPTSTPAFYQAPSSATQLSTSTLAATSTAPIANFEQGGPTHEALAELDELMVGRAETKEIKKTQKTPARHASWQGVASEQKAHGANAKAKQQSKVINQPFESQPKTSPIAATQPREIQTAAKTVFSAASAIARTIVVYLTGLGDLF